MAPKLIENKKEQKDLQKQIEQVNDYKYKQSSKGSELIRKIVFAIIGSCWVLMFAKGEYQEVNMFLKITLVCSFVFLLLDVMHYLMDTCSYHFHAQNLEKSRSAEYLERVYKDADFHISQRSFSFFVLKVIACFAVSITFLIGMFIEFIV